MKKLILLALVLLCGCSTAVTHDRMEGPVVDMRGKDANQHNRDLVECQDRKRNASFVGSARIITDCMAEKGYPIITPRG
jgi:hypothetical protein